MVVTAAVCLGAGQELRPGNASPAAGQALEYDTRPGVGEQARLGVEGVAVQIACVWGRRGQVQAGEGELEEATRPCSQLSENSQIGLKN